jgi:hypothetical protein
VVFSLSDDNLTMTSLLKINNALQQNIFLDNLIPLPQIAVRFRHKVEIDLKKLDNNIFEFANTKKISSSDMIFHPKLDEYAKKLNESYKGKTWEKLSNFTKDSNRAAVDHWEIKKDILKKLNIESLENIESDIKSRLIDVEHTRWNNFHYMHGWKHKKSNKWDNNEKPKKNYQNHKFHPCLVTTKELAKLNYEHNKGKGHYESNDFNNYITMQKIENGD